MLYKVVLTFTCKSVDQTPACDLSNESYIEQYFHVVLFYAVKGLLIGKFVDRSLKVCYH